jgi:DNA-binding transcriptional regulator YdaS (Cro superfamily)
MKTKEAIEKAGSVKALAELLQIKQAAVYQILKPRQSIVIGAKQKPGLKMAQI